MNPQAIAAMQGLKAWDDAQRSTPAPIVATVAATTRRQTNSELLALARATGGTETSRSRAAEALRRQIKTLCAAQLARQNRYLSASELEDLTQDVLLRLLQSPEATEPSAAYIARIASNLLIDRQRHLLRRGQERGAVSLDDTELGETRELPDPAMDVEESALGRIQHAAFRKALATLLKPNEATIVLRRAEGATHDEIAVELGLSCANVRKQAERVMKRLRDHAEAGRFAFA